jgi:hypothetical protein
MQWINCGEKCLLCVILDAVRGARLLAKYILAVFAAGGTGSDTERKIVVNR